MRNVTVIGAGRVGGALAIALSRAGYAIERVVHRGDRFVELLRKNLPETTVFAAEAAPGPEIVIIASGDPEIRGIAESLASSGIVPGYTFHTSGSLSSDELSPLAELGSRTASLHPLAALSDPIAGVDRLRGAYFCVEGQPEALRLAEKIVSDLGGRPFSIPTGSKALYHASAVMAAGHVVALFGAAVNMLERCGLSPVEAADVLRPLTTGSVANLSHASPAEALTGPYARGDAGALARHLEAFGAAGIDDGSADLYLELALRSVDLMIEAGRPFEDLRRRIVMAKRAAE